MVHLSRFAEDLIIYSSLQFGLVALSDAYSTGSRRADRLCSSDHRRSSEHLLFDSCSIHARRLIMLAFSP